MKVHARYAAGPNVPSLGKYLRVEANPEQGGYLIPVFDKTKEQCGDHETHELREIEGAKELTLHAIAANVEISISPTGVVESRDAGTAGGYEKFKGGFDFVTDYKSGPFYVSHVMGNKAKPEWIPVVLILEKVDG